MSPQNNVDAKLRLITRQVYLTLDALRPLKISESDILDLAKLDYRTLHMKMLSFVTNASIAYGQLEEIHKQLLSLGKDDEAEPW